MVDDKNIPLRTVEAVAGNDPFKLAVVFPDNEGTELVDIDRFTLKTVFEGPDLHEGFECTGQAFVFPGDRIILPAFDQEIVALKFF